MWCQNYSFTPFSYHPEQHPPSHPSSSQLITTLYKQLQMIINCHFVVLHTCTQTLFHTQHSREMQEIFRRAHNNKRQYFIESFLIRSVHCKREQFWLSFLFSRLVLSRLTTVVVFLFGSCSRYAIKFLHLRLYYVDSGTQHHNKQDILNSLCSWIGTGLNGQFCFHLARWRNCDVGPD